jgi:hypothetical protein
MQWSFHRPSSLQNSIIVLRNPENGRPLAAYAITGREGENEEDEEEEIKGEREKEREMKEKKKKKNSREMWRQRWRRLKDNSDTADPL